MSSPADIVIIGGGCAGLSLAWQLTQRGLAGRKLVVLEPRTSYRRDRTWCFWNVLPHDFEDLVSHRWPAWRVRRPAGPWVTRTAPGRRYEQLAADRFYDRVLGRLRDTGVELRLGVRAGLVKEDSTGVTIETNQGRLRGAMVFDSRPPEMRGVVRPGSDVALLQHFEGWEVETRSAAFEPAVATLMDFSHPAQPSDGLAFTYVLPTSKTRALIELTWFSPTVLPDDDYAPHVEAWMEQRGLGDHSVLHRERGVLPMRAGSFTIRPSERVHRIGLGGGAAKPSTGYAFQAIQRQSARLAEALERDPIPPTITPRDPVPAVQDAVFLSYMARQPNKGLNGLVQLFETVEPDLLIRFLSDAATPAESLEVMAAMPAGEMMLEVLRSTRLIRSALPGNDPTDP